MTRRQCLGAVLAPLPLSLVGCSPSQVLTTLRAVVASAEYAVSIVGPAAGVPAATLEAINRYLVAVGKATAEAADILAGTGTAAEKSALIVKVFAGVVAGCNCIPAGTPSQIVGVINAVVLAVANFLRLFPSGANARAPLPKVDVDSGARKQLAEIRLRSEAVIGAIERRRP